MQGAFEKMSLNRLPVLKISRSQASPVQEDCLMTFCRWNLKLLS